LLGTIINLMSVDKKKENFNKIITEDRLKEWFNEENVIEQLK